MKRIRLAAVLVAAVLAAAPVFAQQTAGQAEPGVLTLDTVLTYRAKRLGEVKWQADGSGYLMLEPSADKAELFDIARYEVATGQKTILASAEKLTPRGASAPLMIEQFDFSQDGRKILLFTNSARVWRSNTR